MRNNLLNVCLPCYIVSCLRVRAMLVLFSVLLLVPNTMLCYALSLSLVRLFVTPRTVALQNSSVQGIHQARILEWVAMPSSRGS